MAVRLRGRSAVERKAPSEPRSFTELIGSKDLRLRTAALYILPLRTAASTFDEPGEGVIRLAQYRIKLVSVAEPLLKGTLLT